MKIIRTFVLTCLTAFSTPVHAEDFLGVTIAAETQSDSYKRSLYRHWIDEDSDKLDTRQQVLETESLIDVTIITKANGRRVVTDGLWAGPYTGFVTTTPGDLDVDHLVPLKEAHESGAWAWDADKRRSYANDLSNPAHLIAVKAGANRSKGFKDPAEWMPPNRAYWCQYLLNWVDVKRRWVLTMDQLEADAVKHGFRVCEKYASGDSLEGRH
tara:strand:+ start:1649 stop:2284 length:636 start_codon:yes stop_codon:yes gene_type:complete